MAIINIQQIYKKLQKDLGITNYHAVPKITKVVINVGIGQNKTNPKFQEIVEKSLIAITGQKPAPRKARKAISSFKIRQGEIVGLKVTLRRQKMNDFLVKLANIVLPRKRDFRGLRTAGFDKNGNYTLGIAEHIIFPEISHEKAEIPHGLSISIVTTIKDINQQKKLLEAWGFPFEKTQGKPFEKESKKVKEQ